MDEVSAWIFWFLNVKEPPSRIVRLVLPPLINSRRITTYIYIYIYLPIYSSQCIPFQDCQWVGAVPKFCGSSGRHVAPTPVLKGVLFVDNLDSFSLNVANALAELGADSRQRYGGP